MKNTVHLLCDEMLEKLSRLVKYNSVNEEALPGMPFGKTNAECLNEALKIAEELGFSVTNMDNYCGYAEMGEGDDILGIVAHLDIVPEGEGWSYDPFTLTRCGNTVYGRGVSDDKGPLIAALYAMKLVKDSGVPLKKRVRLLMGCNEESGSECMKYYNTHGEPITIGFTPDAEFPGIHGEKGMSSMTAYSKNTSIISMNGGFVSNAVCSNCTTEIPKNAVSVDRLRSQFEKTPLTSFEITEAENSIIIKAEGVAAHASMPNKGINAAGYTMQALQSAGMKDDFVDFYMSHIGVSNDGSGIGCKYSDKYGALTLNNGIVKSENGCISCTIDIRYPVTWTPDTIREKAAPYLEDENGRIEFGSVVEPLFYSEESDLVKNLYNSYVEITGDTVNKPMVIGGGTYAKTVPGIIAFGGTFLDEEPHIHDVNEKIEIDKFEKQVLIYRQAILNLLEC